MLAERGNANSSHHTGRAGPRLRPARLCLALPHCHSVGGEASREKGLCHKCMQIKELRNMAKRKSWFESRLLSHLLRGFF